jgi:hypothetical protein
MNSFAQEFIVGEVVEYVPGNKLIQVCDSLYKAEYIYTDDGVHPISSTTFSSINSRSVVQVFPVDKGVNFWSTKRVIILTGTKRKQMIAEYGLECNRRKNEPKELVN